MKYCSLVLFTAFSFFNIGLTQAQSAETAPDNCQQWFDGCNNCGRGEVGDALMCTEMACMENLEPKCLRFFGEEPLTPPTNVPDNTVTSKKLGGETKTSIPVNCQSWFDGCNNCSVSEDGKPMACTRKWCDQNEEPKCLKFFEEEPITGEETAPPNCQQWFDGCNNCGRGEIGGPLRCTKMACFQNTGAECLKFFGDTEPAKTTPEVETEAKKDFEVLTFKVAPQKKSCVGVAPQQCYVVNGELFYDEIEGFTFEEGISYKLKVLKDLAFDGEVPADASMYNYTLLQVLEKSDPSVIKEFTDIAKNDFATAIGKLQADRIIEGYQDGTYKPSHRINRAEFLTLLMRATGEDFEGSSCFNDVSDQWFAPAICTAKEMGIVEGYQGGNFEPARRINIAEASKIINKILDISVDENLNESWYQKFLKALEDKKALPDSIFAADQEISRGEMAEIVWRVRDNITDKPTQNYEAISSDLPLFGSCDLFGEQLKKSKTNQPYYNDMMFMEGDVMMMNRATTTAMPAMESESAGSADFSDTNIQVAGVDEADIVKTDGEYLYYLRGRQIEIMKAYPAENMAKSSTTELPKNFSAREIMIRGDQMIVMGTSSKPYNNIDEPYVLKDEKIRAMPAIWPPRGGYNRSRTTVLVYDIQDKTDIEKLETISFDGNYQTVRRIDNQLYLVTTENIWNYEIQPATLLPSFQRNEGAEEKLVNCGTVRYIPGHNLRQYTSFIALDLDNLDEKPKQEVIFGGNSGSVYMSTENAYITTPFYQSGRFTDWNWQNDQQQTILFKFSLNDGDIQFEKKGRVQGNLLNQFAMDEDNGHFRVATTTQGKELNNHVFVLNPEMEIVGKINDIAPGEKIYSTRFIGDRLYMVTFRTIDPLFVIDLASPSNPKILGKLKIPGYSNYLHPYDENHLIGFGKDTTESKDQTRAFYEGMKIALFDVSDVSNPKQRHQIIIGDRGTQSELLNNHKALMWDGERKLIGFPIQVAKISDEQRTNNNEGGAWGQTEFSGAHAYEVSLDKGFELVAEISHYSEADLLKMGDYFPQDYQKNIQRMLYIDDTFYTLSQKKVKATDIMSGQDIKTITLQDDDTEKYYPTPVPIPLEEPEVLDMPIPIEPDGGIGDGAESLDELLEE